MSRSLSQSMPSQPKNLGHYLQIGGGPTIWLLMRCPQSNNSSCFQFPGLLTQKFHPSLTILNALGEWAFSHFTFPKSLSPCWKNLLLQPIFSVKFYMVLDSQRMGPQDKIMYAWCVWALWFWGDFHPYHKARALVWWGAVGHGPGGNDNTLGSYVDWRCGWDWLLCSVHSNFRVNFFAIQLLFVCGVALLCQICSCSMVSHAT